MESDLQRFYNVDLGAMYDGRLSVWRVARLVYALPPEAATVTGVPATAWAVREVWEAVAGAEHPALARERGRAEKAAKSLRVARMRAQIEADKARRGRVDG